MNKKDLFFAIAFSLFFTFFFIFFYTPKSDVSTQNPDLSFDDIPAPYEDKVLGVATFHDPMDGGDPQPSSPSKKYTKIPVLMYHNIAPVPIRGSASYRGLYVSPGMFEQQMAYLKRNKYKTLTSQQFYEILRSGKNPYKKSVMLTFDDGSRGQYTVAYPILKKYKLTGVFYIIQGRSPITMQQAKRMSQHGMVIDSHTMLHEDLKRVKSTKQLRYEIKGSKKNLEALTGKEIVSIAYPGCVADSRSFKIAKDAGYKLGFSCGSTIYHRYGNRFYLSRVHVFSNMSSFQRALTVGL